MQPSLTFDAADDAAAPFIATAVAKGARPKIAILREQGVNGQVEMAAAFDRAGFEAHDVHMSDLIAGRVSLAGFRASPRAAGSPTATCSARGAGWAKAILFNARTRDEFSALLRARRHLRARRVQRLPDDEQSARADPGSRALAAIREEPLRAVRGAAGDGGGAALRRRCSSPEWRAAACRCRPRTARGGRCSTPSRREAKAIVALRFVDNRGRADRGLSAESQRVARTASPGSPPPDGRFTILMPHPERAFRAVQQSWHPRGSGEDSPWMRMFRNARKRVRLGRPTGSSPSSAAPSTYFCTSCSCSLACSCCFTVSKGGSGCGAHVVQLDDVPAELALHRGLGVFSLLQLRQRIGEGLDVGGRRIPVEFAALVSGSRILRLLGEVLEFRALLQLGDDLVRLGVLVDEDVRGPCTPCLRASLSACRTRPATPRPSPGGPSGSPGSSAWTSTCWRIRSSCARTSALFAKPLRSASCATTSCVTRLSTIILRACSLSGWPWAARCFTMKSTRDLGIGLPLTVTGWEPSLVLAAAWTRWARRLGPRRGRDAQGKRGEQAERA